MTIRPSLVDPAGDRRGLRATVGAVGDDQGVVPRAQEREQLVAVDAIGAGDRRHASPGVVVGLSVRSNCPEDWVNRTWALLSPGPRGLFSACESV